MRRPDHLRPKLDLLPLQLRKLRTLTRYAEVAFTARKSRASTELIALPIRAGRLVTTAVDDAHRQVGAVPVRDIAAIETGLLLPT